MTTFSFDYDDTWTCESVKKMAQRSRAEMKYSADKSTGTAHFPDGNKVSFLFRGGRSYNTFAIRFEPAQ